VSNSGALVTSQLGEMGYIKLPFSSFYMPISLAIFFGSSGLFKTNSFSSFRGPANVHLYSYSALTDSKVAF
jgi:hypothetical protein